MITIINMNTTKPTKTCNKCHVEKYLHHLSYHVDTKNKYKIIHDE